MQQKFRTRSAALACATAAMATLGLGPTIASAAISVQTTSNGVTMVNTLVGTESGITVVDGSVSYTGGSTASGTFSGANFLGTDFSSGVVLTTGNAGNLDGPNSGPSDYSTNNGFTGGNTNLNAIVSPRTTQNASTLKFSFIPTADVISFQFVFGSDEYSEFVGSQFNDAFGFFLNGKNIALIPGTNTAIAINNVNNGNPDDNTPASNSQFFTDNDPDDGVDLDTKLDGLVGQKMQLFAQGSVNPGVENTIEIAVADTTDSSYDSAVFLKASSFVDEPPEPPPPTGIPLPAGAWAGAWMLGGLGVVSKIKQRLRRA